MKKVLCLDDDRTIAEMVARVVRFCGHEPVVETNSVDALVRWSRGGLAAAIVDYLMPGVDGVEVLASLQEHTPSCRRILLTAAPKESAVLDALSSGIIQRVIAKPPLLDDLSGALDWL